MLRWLLDGVWDKYEVVWIYGAAESTWPTISWLQFANPGAFGAWDNPGAGDHGWCVMKRLGSWSSRRHSSIYINMLYLDNHYHWVIAILAMGQEKVQTICQLLFTYVLCILNRFRAWVKSFFPSGLSEHPDLTRQWSWVRHILFRGLHGAGPWPKVVSNSALDQTTGFRQGEIGNKSIAWLVRQRHLGRQGWAMQGAQPVIRLTINFS